MRKFTIILSFGMTVMLLGCGNSSMVGRTPREIENVITIVAVEEPTVRGV